MRSGRCSRRPADETSDEAPTREAQEGTDAAGNVAGVTSPIPGGSATVTADLHPGTDRLFCSLFAGTPESHYAHGMHTTITVR